MTFQKPPNISRRAIDRAGDALISSASTQIKLQLARDTLNKWRACHAYPINTFQATLRRKVSRGLFGGNPIIAQRLKRAPTIISKLKEGRDYDVKLLNMHDIAGVRAILLTMEDVRKLEHEYRDSKRFEHILHRHHDYITEPKERDGYRSVHLIYKYKNKIASEWNGLLIELQIRTKLQHSWATAVETIHTFLGRAVKTRQGQKSDQQWTNFFKLVSSAFAYIEETPLCSDHLQMSPQEILEAIKKYEKDLKVLSKLRAFPVAFNLIKDKTRNSYYYVIVLDIKQSKVIVHSFARKDFEEANLKYAQIEKNSINKDEIESVLVSATEVEEAYPSFFVNTDDFAKNLKYVLSGTWIKS